MKYYHEIKTFREGTKDEYVRDLGYDFNKLPLNKPIWGFAYDINDDTEHRRLSCLPVQGEISENNIKGKWCKYCFFPHKKNTKQRRKSGAVDANSRMYADTYEEASEMYNELVQKRIDNLYYMIQEAEKEKIGVSNEEKKN